MRRVALTCATLGTTCVAAIAFTLFRTLHIEPVPGRVLSITSGCVRFAWWDPRQLSIAYDTFEIDRADSALRWLPYHDRQPLAQSVGLPLWIPAAALILLCLRARRRAIRPGFCPHCDYDLRGTPPDAACPECGSAHTPRSPARDEIPPRGCPRGGVDHRD